MPLQFLMLISFPFSLSTTISFSWISSLGWCFSNKAFILCFFFFTQYLLHSVVTVWKLYNLCAKSTHLCFNQKFTQMWGVGDAICLVPHFWMVKWSAVYWLSIVLSIITYLLGGGGQVGAILLPSYASSNLLVLEAIAYVICQNMWISLF